MRFRPAIALISWIIGPLPALAQLSSGRPSDAAPRTEVLVLGVFHMANPGRDMANTNADDVLAPRRQAEIAEVIAALKRFNPTKIAVESPFYEDVAARRYADYAAGKQPLSRNETQQIGFRLAKELGHKTIYAVDADGEFPFPRVEDYAKARGHAQALDTLMAELRATANATNAYLASHSVLETLLYLNADERATDDIGWHYRVAHLGEPWNWAGADLVADYFRRNMRIYSNVMHIAESPAERVLVVYGFGHLGWLREIFGNDPTVRVRKLSEFAR